MNVAIQRAVQDPYIRPYIRAVCKEQQVTLFHKTNVVFLTKERAIMGDEKGLNGKEKRNETPITMTVKKPSRPSLNSSSSPASGAPLESPRIGVEGGVAAGLCAAFDSRRRGLGVLHNGWSDSFRKVCLGPAEVGSVGLARRRH